MNKIFFLYENNHGHAQSHEDIFHPLIPSTSTNYSFSSILNSTSIKSLPTHSPTVHVSNHPIPYHTTNRNDLVNEISTVINKADTTGLYSLQINTDIQNDSGANRLVINLQTILHDYRDIPPYPIGEITASGPAIHCTRFEYLHWQCDKFKGWQMNGLCKIICGIIT